MRKGGTAARQGTAAGIVSCRTPAHWAPRYRHLSQPLKTVSLEGAASPANVSLILVFETADILFEPDNSSSSVTGDFEGERQIGHYNSHPQKTTTTKALLSQNTSGDARGKLCWRQ